MALAYLLDPTNQYQNVAGVNNVAGWVEVFISDTAERADVYVDFAGTRAPERIYIDNDGRAVMIVDSEGVYRVEMHAPNGDLLWTQYPVWPVGQGGGGAIGVDIGSSDGSIYVQRTQVGSVVNYDLSVAADGTDLLVWGEYVGYTMDGTHMVPSYSAGTIETGPHGIRLQGGQYYHITVTLGASSTEQNVYDAFQVSFEGADGDGVVSTFATKSFHYDASTGEGHSYDVSFDVMPATDVELYAEATGLESGISAGIAEVYVHRVYSGAPAIPGGVADKEWVEDNFQGKLTAGTGIDITDDVISVTGTFSQEQADWAQSDSSAVDYIKNKPDLSVYATGAELTAGLATKQDVISDIADIRAGAALGATAVQPGSLATVATTGSYDDLSDKPTIPAALSAGDGISIASDVVSAKVDGTTISVNVDGELVALGTGTDSAFLARYGTTTYQEIAAAVADNRAVFVTGSANALTAVMPMTSFNTNPAMVLFGTLIGSTEQTVKLDQGVWSCDYEDIQADWSETNQLKPSYIANRPANLVQDASYVHTDNNFTNADVTKLSGIAAGAEVNVQSDWNVTDTSSDAYIANKPTIPAAPVQSDWNESDSSSLAYIQNKPSIPVVPATKPLVAGSNISITENTNDVTISATASPQLQANWNETNTSSVQYIQNKPTIPTLPTTKPLVAGSNITITENTNDVTIAASGGAQVQANWNETDNTDPSYIQNKPSIPVIGTITL